MLLECNRDKKVNQRREQIYRERREKRKMHENRKKEKCKQNRKKEKCKQNRKREEKERDLQLLLVFSSPVTIVRFFNLLYVTFDNKETKLV